jgi:hypothetical protein
METGGGTDAGPNDLFFSTRDEAIKLGIGTVSMWAGPRGALPDNWLLCDGRALDPRDKKYFALYSVIGTVYGAGPDGTKFQLPDLTGRTAFGSSDKDPKYKVGQQFGEASQHGTIHLNLPGQRFFSPVDPNLENPYPFTHVPAGPVDASFDVETLPPTLVLSYIIKYAQGV